MHRGLCKVHLHKEIPVYALPWSVWLRDCVMHGWLCNVCLFTSQHLPWSRKRKLLFSHCKNYKRQKYDRKRQLYNILVKGSISLPLGWTNLNKEGGIVNSTQVQPQDVRKWHILCRFPLTWRGNHASMDTQWQEKIVSFYHIFNAMFTTLIDILETSRICQRNPDHWFIPLQKERQGIFKDASGSSTVAYVDSRTALTVIGQTVPETIWHTSCEILIRNERCTMCNKFCGNLRTMDLRFQKQQATTCDKRTKPDSHVNNRYLSSQEKQEKILSLKNAVKRAERCAETLSTGWRWL